jgi:hypothetical protein
VEEHLPGKCKALSLVPSTQIEKKSKTKNKNLGKLMRICCFQKKNIISIEFRAVFPQCSDQRKCKIKGEIDFLGFKKKCEEREVSRD